MAAPITLISHSLCPYVQRIAIALVEKRVEHERRFVDLANKPQWFLDISPLGRTPVLQVGKAALFESGAILEYLDETMPNPLHPTDPVARAHHRAWISFGSECLNEIAGFYSAPDMQTLNVKAAALHARFRVIESQLGQGPWFEGVRFSLVDAVFAPVFRYFDTFDQIDDFGAFDGLTGVLAWRRALATRDSVREAVAADYDTQLAAFLRRRGSALSGLMPPAAKSRRRSA